MSLRLAIDQEQIRKFCARWRVKELSLFGSVLTSDFGPDSDVDVLVDLKDGHGLSLYDWVDMIDELEAMFGREVHLVARKGLKNPLRREEVLRTAETVYAA